MKYKTISCLSFNVKLKPLQPFSIPFPSLTFSPILHGCFLTSGNKLPYDLKKNIKEQWQDAGEALNIVSVLPG